jgi:hypothetical protein
MNMESTKRERKIPNSVSEIKIPVTLRAPGLLPDLLIELPIGIFAPGKNDTAGVKSVTVGSFVDLCTVCTK